MEEVKTAGELKIKGGNVHERADYTVRELTIQHEKVLTVLCVLTSVSGCDKLKYNVN